MKKINLYNQFHLGDNIFTLHYLNKFINDDVSFEYYVHDQYIDELNKHVKNKNITLLSLSNSIPTDARNMWIGYENYYYEVLPKHNYMFDLFYVDFFKMTSEKLGLDIKIKDKYDMLFDNSNFTFCLWKNYDYLIINSVPNSGQFNYNEYDFIKLCDFFNERNITFITTRKIKNYECTLDYNMSIVDIGNLSNYCNNIIAVNTGPIVTTFTIQNINKVNKRFIFDNFLNYSFNDRIYRFDNISSIYDKL